MTRGVALQAVCRVILVALAVAAPVALGRMQTWEPWALVLVVGAAALVWVLSGRGFLPGLGWNADGLLVTALAWTALSCFVSVSLYDSLERLALLAAGITLTWLARVALANANWNAAAWWSLAAGAFVAGIWGLREYSHSALGSGNVSWRAFGPFYNPNCLGGYLALCFLIPVALLLVARMRAVVPVCAPTPRSGKKGRQVAVVEEYPSRYPEIAGFFAALICGLGLLVSGSKGSLLALVAGVTLFGLIAGDWKTALGRTLRLGAAGLVLVAVLGAVALPSVRTRVLSAFGSQQNSGDFRLCTWQGTVEMITARPALGYGPGTFEHAYPRHAKAGFTRQAHQTPLQIVAEQGVPGGLWMLAALGVLVAQAWRQAARREGTDRLLPAAAVAGALGLWVHNLVDYTWYVTAHQAVFWVLLGLASAPADEADAVAPAGQAGRRVGLAAAGFLVVAALVALVSETELAAGRQLARMGASQVAESHLLRVLPVDARRWVEASLLEEHMGARGRPEALTKALELRQRALALQPTEPTHYNALARICEDLEGAGEGEEWLREAQECLRKGIEYYPTSVEMLGRLMRLQERTGQGAKALVTARRLADLYDTPVRTAQAVEYFIDRQYADAFLLLAGDRMAAGDPAGALYPAMKAGDVAAFWVLLQRTNRQILELSGRYDPAEIARMESVARDAMNLLQELDRPLGNYRRALALYRLGELEEARAGLDEIIEKTDPAGDLEKQVVVAEAHLMLVDVLRQMGEDASADAVRETAVPKARGALKALQEARPEPFPGWKAEDTLELETRVRAAGA